MRDIGLGSGHKESWSLKVSSAKGVGGIPEYVSQSQKEG